MCRKEDHYWEHIVSKEIASEVYKGRRRWTREKFDLLYASG